jgi:exonuclease III
VNTSESSIVCLTETHVTEEITSSELNIKNFRLEQCCTENIRTGGVMIYVKKGIKYEVEKIERIEDYVWMVSLKFNLANENYLLTAIYHSPNKQEARFISYFEEYLEEVQSFDGKKIIVGDFNYDVSTNTFYVKKYKDLIYRNGLFQIVNIPTRQTIM